ncbi:hypothetical protein ACIA8B_14850 [Micromonospora chalcea]
MSKPRTGVEFRPLDFIRGVMTDDHLDTREKAVLVAAAIGTDNASFKVKRSLARLAESAKCDRGSMSELVERPQVVRYLAKIDRPNRRRVDLWLRQEPAQHVDPIDMLPGVLSVPSTQHVDPIDITCRPGRLNMSTPSTPSAPHLPPSASSLPSVFVRPSQIEKPESSVWDLVEPFTPAAPAEPVKVHPPEPPVDVWALVEAEAARR